MIIMNRPLLKMLMQDLAMASSVVNYQDPQTSQRLHTRVQTATFGFRLLLERKFEPKGRTCARCALHPDLTLHKGNKLLGNGQPEAGAAVLARGRSINLSEFLKNPRRSFEWDADSGILHLKPEYYAVHR